MSSYLKHKQYFFKLFLFNYNFNIILYLIYHLLLFCDYVKTSKSCLLIKNSNLFKVSHFLDFSIDKYDVCIKLLTPWCDVYNRVSSPEYSKMKECVEQSVSCRYFRWFVIFLFDKINNFYFYFFIQNPKYPYIGK